MDVRLISKEDLHSVPTSILLNEVLSREETSFGIVVHEDSEEGAKIFTNIASEDVIDILECISNFVDFGVTIDNKMPPKVRPHFHRNTQRNHRKNSRRFDK